jgi:hypothetical protein
MSIRKISFAANPWYYLWRFPKACKQIFAGRHLLTLLSASRTQCGIAAKRIATAYELKNEIFDFKKSRREISPGESPLQTLN